MLPHPHTSDIDTQAISVGAVMKVEPDPGRHALLIAVQDYGEDVVSRCKGLEGTCFRPLETACTDAKMMEQAGLYLGCSWG